MFSPPASLRTEGAAIHPDNERFLANDGASPPKERCESVTRATELPTVWQSCAATIRKGEPLGEPLTHILGP
jgi:hypothetical protein